MNIQDFSFEENLFDSQSAVKKTVHISNWVLLLFKHQPFLSEKEITHYY